MDDVVVRIGLCALVHLVSKFTTSCPISPYCIGRVSYGGPSSLDMHQ